MEGPGGDRIRISFYTLRYSGPPINPFHIGSCPTCYAPKRVGYRIWNERPPCRLCVGYLQGGRRGGGGGYLSNWADGVVGLHGVARGSGGAEGALCDQFCAPETALVERVGQDGDSARVRYEPVEGRLSNELGRQVALPALLCATPDARKLPVSVWWACMQMYCVAVWMGDACALVYEANAARCQVSKERVGVPNSRGSTLSYARPPTVVALPLGATVGGQAVDYTRSSWRLASLVIRRRAAGKGRRCWSIWGFSSTQGRCGCL
jgi:hypothetical protein